MINIIDDYLCREYETHIGDAARLLDTLEEKGMIPPFSLDIFAIDSGKYDPTQGPAGYKWEPENDKT